MCAAVGVFRQISGRPIPDLIAMVRRAECWGSHVKAGLVKLSLVASIAWHPFALAQAPQAPSGAVSASAAGVGQPNAARPVIVASNGRAMSVADEIRIAAAGSVIILADDSVIGANIARINPPAPGFVYER